MRGLWYNWLPHKARCRAFNPDGAGRRQLFKIRLCRYPDAKDPRQAFLKLCLSVPNDFRLCEATELQRMAGLRHCPSSSVMVHFRPSTASLAMSYSDMCSIFEARLQASAGRIFDVRSLRKILPRVYSQRLGIPLPLVFDSYSILITQCTHGLEAVYIRRLTNALTVLLNFESKGSQISWIWMRRFIPHGSLSRTIL